MSRRNSLTRNAQVWAAEAEWVAAADAGNAGAEAMKKQGWDMAAMAHANAAPPKASAKNSLPAILR
jgi:hypothetical protein